MGNSLSTTGTGPSSAAARQTSGADSFLGELGGEVQYDKRCAPSYQSSVVRSQLIPLCHSMGTSRFLKTIRGRHKQGALVVKVFVKADPAVSLKAFHRRIKGLQSSTLLLVQPELTSASLRSGAGSSRRLSQCPPLPASHRD